MVSSQVRFLPKCRSVKVKAKVLEAGSSSHDKNAGRNSGVGVKMVKVLAEQAGSSLQTLQEAGMINRSLCKGKL